MHNHHRPPDLYWPHAVAAAAARERASQSAAWHLQQQRQQQYRVPLPPPPPHVFRDFETPRQIRQETAAASADDGEQGEEVVVIHDSEYDNDVAYMLDYSDRTKRKRGEGSSENNKKKKKRHERETSYQQRHAPSGIRTTHPIVPRPSNEALPLAGVFVSGVMSGRLLETEREANRKRAFANIIMSGQGFDHRAVENPPPRISLSLEQVRTLGDGFLEDRNHAVREAVRIAHAEMKEEHRQVIMKHAEMLQRETARRLEAESILKTVNAEANSHINERIKLAAENVQLREELNKQAEQQSDSHIRLAAENVQLREELSGKVGRKYDSHVKLTKEFVDLKRQLIKQAKENNKEIAFWTEQLNKKSKEEDALKQEISMLKAKLEYQETRQARSLSAFMEASVHSLRLLQSKRDSH